MALSKITGRYVGIGELLRSPEMEALCLERAVAVMAVAVATAPVFERGPHPGRYKAAFHVKSGTDNGEAKPRAYARVINDSPEALAVEFGTANNDAHHTLLRALEAASGGSVKAVVETNTPRGGSPRLNPKTGKPVTAATVRRRKAAKERRRAGQ